MQNPGRFRALYNAPTPSWVKASTQTIPTVGNAVRESADNSQKRRRWSGSLWDEGPLSACDIASTLPDD